LAKSSNAQQKTYENKSYISQVSEILYEKTAGSWRIVCRSGEECRAAQSIVVQSTRDPVMVARLYRKPEPTLTFTMPLGGFIAPGLSIAIDKAKPTRLPFEMCTVEGCVIGIKLGKPVLERLAKAKTLSVTVYPTAHKPLTLDFSLAEFKTVWDALP
jgi:invasion protein IalB